ncbi:MAG: hypothetical protein ACE5MI_05480 [Acidimicrobiia bacterium]
MVTDDHRCVLGLIRFRDAVRDSDGLAIEAMQLGPTTKRPDEPLEPLVRRMRERNVATILITAPTGNLLGLLDRNEAERQLEQIRQTLTWEDCEGCRGTPAPRP